MIDSIDLNLSSITERGGEGEGAPPQAPLPPAGSILSPKPLKGGEEEAVRPSPRYFMGSACQFRIWKNPLSPGSSPPPLHSPSGLVVDMVRQVHIGAGPKEADLSRRKEEQKQSLLSACTSRKWYQCFSERIFASAGGGGGGGAFKRANYTLTTAAHCPCVGCCMVPVSMGTGEVGRSMQINKCLRAGAASVRCLTCTALERVRERILCGDAMHFKASCQHLAQPLPSIYVHSRV